MIDTYPVQVQPIKYTAKEHPTPDIALSDRPFVGPVQSATNIQIYLYPFRYEYSFVLYSCNFLHKYIWIFAHLIGIYLYLLSYQNQYKCHTLVQFLTPYNAYLQCALHTPLM